MHGYQRMPTVLARIPNLNHYSHGQQEADRASPSDGKRLLSQSMSFKLLAGCVCVLVCLAVVPMAFRHHSEGGTSPAPEADLAPAWQPSPPVASTEPAAPAAQQIPEAPVLPAPVQIGATTTPNAPVTPVPVQCAVAADAKVVPASATAEEPLMSAWPNPLHAAPSQPVATAQDPGACANQSMAIHPSTYSK